MNELNTSKTGAAPRVATWRTAPHRSAALDGWMGTPQFPGYRAGSVIVRLSYLPQVAQQQLYLDVLLLDRNGRTCEALSGACSSLGIAASPDARSRFVCLIAELLRHAGDDERRFGAIAPAVAQLRELGVERAPLMAAAKVLDVACSEACVIDSLADMLEHSLGEDDAQRTAAEILDRLVRTRVIHAGGPADGSLALKEQLAALVRGLGKHRIRHVLRMSTMFDLVPQVEMYRF